MTTYTYLNSYKKSCQYLNPSNTVLKGIIMKVLYVSHVNKMCESYGICHIVKGWVSTASTSRVITLCNCSTDNINGTCNPQIPPNTRLCKKCEKILNKKEN